MTGSRPSRHLYHRQSSHLQSGCPDAVIATMNVASTLVKKQFFHHSGLVRVRRAWRLPRGTCQTRPPSVVWHTGHIGLLGTLLCSIHHSYHVLQAGILTPVPPLRPPTTSFYDTPSRSSNKRSRHPPPGQSAGSRHCVPRLPISTPFVPPLFSSPHQLARATLALLPHWSASIPRLLAPSRAPVSNARFAALLTTVSKTEAAPCQATSDATQCPAASAPRSPNSVPHCAKQPSRTWSPLEDPYLVVLRSLPLRWKRTIQGKAQWHHRGCANVQTWRPSSSCEHTCKTVQNTCGKEQVLDAFMTMTANSKA